MPSEVEIGVWVDGAQKWVTGVTRRTSCHDIIKALLRAQSLPATDPDVNEYVLVERWRKVERPLDHEQRILKVWRTWGEAIQEVRFTLRRIRADDSDSETGSRVERSRRRHKWRQSSNIASKGHSTQRINHASASKKGVDSEVKKNETMERLMRLVVAQGETIQTQLRRMQERDQQIENFEQQLHLFRVQNMGSDYLLQSYLKDPSAESHSHHHHRHRDTPPFSKEEEKSNDSGVVTEEVGDSDGRPSQSEKSKLGINHSEELEDVKNKTILLEQLDKVLVRLLEHEEAMARLEDSLTESAVCELAQLEEEISNAAAIHAQTVASARQNELKLREFDMMLYQRRMTLESLLEEDAKYEQEALALQAHLDYIIHLPPTAFQLPENGIESETRSPEDTFNRLTISSNKPAVPLSSCSHSKLISTNAIPITVSQKSMESKTPDVNVSSIPKSFLKDKPTLSKPKVNDTSRDLTKDVPPPLPTTSPPPLDEEDDKDSAKTSSLCVSSCSSNSSDSSRRGTSPCSGTISKSTQKSISENTKDVDSTDTNSDTGLSSLHSSSDEGAYVFDTLV